MYAQLPIAIYCPFSKMKIVTLAGGVGGAKLAEGLAQVLQPNELTIIVNTGDDFSHYGLNISPDLDTICYTLAGIANRKTGWGRSGDTYNMLHTLGELGGETWFLLGDKDLALHLERTRLLNKGLTLTQVTNSLLHSLGIQQSILPMSDDPIHTMVNTLEFGHLTFQDYFVNKHFFPQVRGFNFIGIDSATPAPGVLEAIQNADAIIISPSNPWVSIDPILMVPGILSSIKKKKSVAISPIISGSAVRGPAAKMFSELGIASSAVAVYRHYSHFLTGFIFDEIDQHLSSEMPIQVLATKTKMNSLRDRVGLAENVLDFIQTL
jgi:LPPG:FO 2-phospho-L-lactate transferase